MKPRKIEYRLDNEYLWSLFLEQDKRCALSGVEINFFPNYTSRNKTKQTASLDRIDNTKGYIKGNVQWVHKSVNLMKNKYNQQEFIQWCKLISRHRV
jgi:hypothetical protein